MKTKIEICLDSVESIINAEAGGADRVELCSDLFEGGLTPTLGTLITAKKHTSIPINVMIRPRGGDFCYSDEEFESMCIDAKLFREHGANALVFGILNPDGTIDKERSARLIEIADGIPVTFHRAFDMTPDPFKAMETLIDLKVDRVLTSGLEESVLEGVPLLKTLIERYGDKIVIMPGCGISERNFLRIDRQLHAREYHVHLHSPRESRMTWRPSHIYMGGLLRQPEFDISHTDSARVSGIAKAARR